MKPRFDHLPGKIYPSGAICRVCGCEWVTVSTGQKGPTVWAKDMPCPKCARKEKIK